MHRTRPLSEVKRTSRVQCEVSAYRCTTAKERRITRWERAHGLEAVQQRLDEHRETMRQRRRQLGSVPNQVAVKGCEPGDIA